MNKQKNRSKNFPVPGKSNKGMPNPNSLDSVAQVPIEPGPKVGKLGQLIGDKTGRKVLCIDDYNDRVTLFTLLEGEQIGTIPGIPTRCIKWDK